VHIIIGGCGRLGAEIAERLSADAETDVVVTDIDPLAFDRLGRRSTARRWSATAPTATSSSRRGSSAPTG
jgi:Trk K+ transport system NAD-binding subunit